MNDIEKPIYIKKWSNCDEKLVFKLNAQIMETSGSSSSDNADHCLKVLQIVKKDGSEIILKYNTGSADLVSDHRKIVTAEVTES